MGALTGGKLATLLLALAVVLLPFINYRRGRLAGERLGQWLARTETVRMNELGQALRAAPWLTPALFLRSLSLTGSILYGIFWFMALVTLFGDVANVPWTWRRLASPLEPLALVLELLLVLTIINFGYLFGRGRPADVPFDMRRLSRHWLALLAYCWLSLQSMAWFIAEPQFYITRKIVMAPVSIIAPNQGGDAGAPG